jgi:hypothetical protein
MILWLKIINPILRLKLDYPINIKNMGRDTTWDDPQLSDGDMRPLNQKLRTEQINEHHHKVMFNNRLLGHIVMDIDGYYYFDFVTAPNGLWTSYSLRMVADVLEKMNKPHEERIKEFFKDEL